MRIKVLRIAVALVFVFLCFVLFYFQVLRNDYYRQLSESNRIRLIPQEGGRGRIFDRNNNIIVDNRLYYNVVFFFQQNDNIKKTFARLAKILKISEAEINKKFKQATLSFFAPVVLAEKIDKKNAIVIEELRSELPGVFIQSLPCRFYPHGRLAAHILGYLGEIGQWRLMKLKKYGYRSKDIVGYGGVEERYDYYLRQRDGGFQVEVDNRGRVMRIIGFKPPQSGKDIQLTINLQIQEIAEQGLSGKNGAVIVMDSYTGEILAMASSPAFSPGSFLDESYPKKNILNDLDAPLLNRGISGLYSLGSVFKLVLAAAGLETKLINTATSFNCEGKIELGKREYLCWDVHGIQNLIQAIRHSCNVFFYRLGLLLGPEKIYKYATRLGFGRPTKIDLPSEASGSVPNPLWKRLTKFENWYKGDTVNFSIGQGDLLVTPIQTACFMASLANGEYLPRPHLIKAIDGKQVNLSIDKINVINFDDNVLIPIKEGLRQVVNDPTGTANILADAGVPIAGKTGTVQVTYGLPHVWFAGYCPIKEPRFTICVFLEHSGLSVNACRVAKYIIMSMKDKGLL